MFAVGAPKLINTFRDDANLHPINADMLIKVLLNSGEYCPVQVQDFLGP